MKEETKNKNKNIKKEHNDKKHDKQEDVVRTALLYPYDAEKLIESRAGLATVFVNAYKRLPCPPAKSIATHSFLLSININLSILFYHY